MNRRAALLATLLAGGWLGRRAFARQERKQDDPTNGDDGNSNSNSNDDGGATTSEALPDQPGNVFKSFDITPYTKLRHTTANPEKAILNWILRGTGQATWFGERIASLSATPNDLRVYHDAKVVRQIQELLGRFINANADVIALNIQVVTTTDPRWRYTVFSRLKPLATGAAGQQVWTTKLADSARATANMELDSGFRRLHQQRYEIINGQNQNIRIVNNRNYAAEIRRDGPAGSGAQLGVKTIEEGVTIQASPLLQFDDDAVELFLSIKAISLKNTLRTRVIAPQSVGPGETSIEIPETIESRLETTINPWNIGETLIISMGVLPNLLPGLARRGGILSNVRIGATPELLVILDSEVISRNKLTRRNRDSRSQ